jgi:plasmid stabilization system protein ParE
MSFRLRITDEAAEQLLAIAERYAQTSQSLEIAAAWYDGIIKDLESLEQNPLRCAVAPESELFEFELREMLYGSGKRLTHRALFRIDGNSIEVLTIRHHAQRPLEPGDL